MRTEMKQMIGSDQKNKQFKKYFKVLFPIVSLLVIIGVFWWLKLIGITFAGDAFCGMVEHTHDESCRAVCNEAHEHTDACTAYICGLEEHTHVSSCYPDPDADVETEDDWEATVRDIPLNNDAKTLVAVAKSQLGYTESTRNYFVGTDGIRRGYTRYGDWYGNPYGDWSSMFTAFCLRYAGFRNMPISSGSEAMRVKWEQIGLYQEAAIYTPHAGDIVFLDKNGNGTTDATAILTEISSQRITVIEGDVEGKVAETTYSLNEGTVIGYGLSIPSTSLLLMDAGDQSDGVIAKTTAYNRSLMTETNLFVLYVTSGGNHYAFDGNGNAVQIFIDASGNITSNTSDPDSLLWTFTASGGANSYLIKNVSTGKYMHSHSSGVTTGGAYTSTITQVGEGIRVRSNNEYAYYNQRTGAFQMTQSQSSAAVYNMGVTSRCTVWLDGTNGGIMSLGGSLDKSYTIAAGSTIKLPLQWQTPTKYHYSLQGWYDVKTNKYYPPGAEVVINDNTVFYADWVAASYDVGQFNSLVANTVSTNSFVTTRVFDYNSLFNVLSQNANVTVNASGHSETWNQVTGGRVNYNGGSTLDFSFIDYDAGGDISYSNNRGANNTNGGVYSGLYSERLHNVLFGTDNAFDPNTGEGIIGKQYLGTADYLFSFMNDPRDAHYGYYYYDSKLHAASFNQTAQRFYVYDYLERTADSEKDGGAGAYSDFLPFNSPYVNTNGNLVHNYTYNGEKNEYNGVRHYQYDAKYDTNNNSIDNIGTNYWFGMSIDVNFYLPNLPGTVDRYGNYGNQDLMGNDMHFQFSGDDDVWVLVDGKLVLDIGGVHGIESGDINFATGVITVNGEQVGTLDGVDAGEHILTVLYLERGSSQSNCAIYFNLAPRFHFSIRKEDVLTQDVLNGAEFSVYTDKACTIPAELWSSEEAFMNLEPSTNVFTVTDGVATMWGLSSGQTYYIKETKPPEKAGYSRAYGIICLTLDMKGVASYSVEVIAETDGNGNPLGPSHGFTVHGFRIDEETQEAFIVVTNAPEWVNEVTEVEVNKIWNDSIDHTYDSVTVYLTMTELSGTVRRIREITLSEENDWKYIWDNLPKYHEDGVTPIQYGVEEAYKSGYHATVQAIPPTGSGFAYRITNTPLDEETSLTVKKEWDVGMSTTVDYQQAQVTIKLYADGKDTGRTITLSLKNGWTDTFLGLPYKDDEGNVIVYSIEEAWVTEDWLPSYGEVKIVESAPGEIPTYETTVTNIYRWGRGYELPGTGGVGSLPWIFSGLVLILSSLGCGCMKRRKRERRGK